MHQDFNQDSFLTFSLIKQLAAFNILTGSIFEVFNERKVKKPQLLIDTEVRGKSKHPQRPGAAMKDLFN